MVEKKVNIMKKDERPFYVYFADKLFDEYSIGDILLAGGIGITTACLYLKLCKKKITK